MEMAGLSYLETLAVIAITFAGFATLIMVFRQMLGGKITRLDAFVMRSFIQLGFMATAGATLPPLLSLFPFPIREDWRVASAGISLWLGIWSVTFRHRRNLVSKVHAPRPIYVVIVIFWLTTITLLANAVLAPERFMAGLYSAAVTIILAGGATFLMMSLIYLVDQPIEHVHRRPQQGG